MWKRLWTCITSVNTFLWNKKVHVVGARGVLGFQSWIWLSNHAIPIRRHIITNVWTYFKGCSTLYLQHLKTWTIDQIKANLLKIFPPTPYGILHAYPKKTPYGTHITNGVKNINTKMRVQTFKWILDSKIYWRAYQFQDSICIFYVLAVLHYLFPPPSKLRSLQLHPQRMMPQ